MRTDREFELAVNALAFCDWVARGHQIDQRMLAALERVRADLTGPARPPSPPLTPAEARLVPALATHMTFAEIAALFSLSRHTVKTQAISIYRELGVTSRGAAVSRATELGLIKPRAK